LKFQLHFYALIALLPIALCTELPAQTPASKSPATEDAGDRPPRGDFEPEKGSTPRTAEGRPDLTGYWIPSHKDKPGGNIGKDYPDYKLPFTAEGQAALKYNFEHTVDPEALCIVGGVPRHNASGLPFEIVQGKDHSAFLYWYTTYRLIPFNGEKHSEDPDPSFFGEEIGSWENDTFVIDSISFKEKKTWADENANPHSDQLHLVERWTRPDLGHLHLEEVINDPKFYKEPIHYQRTWLLGKKDQELKEYSCSEDNVDAPHLGPGPGVIEKSGERGFGGKLAPLPPPPDKNHPAVTSIPD
jgi:hypothetical protein